MNTQSHVIIGAALLGRGIPKRAWIAAAGGLLPDIPMLLIVLGLKLAGYPAQQIFVELYWQNWWQISNGLSHNFWLWGGLALLAVAMRERLANTAQYSRHNRLLVIGHGFCGVGIASRGD